MNNAELLNCWRVGISHRKNRAADCRKRKAGCAGLMSRLLNGKQRLNGFNAAWRYAYLGELFRERVEVNWNDLQLLPLRERTASSLSELNRKDSSNDDKSKYQRICPGDIGYNTDAYVARSFGTPCYEGIISPAYTVCTPSPGMDGTPASYPYSSYPR